MNAQIFDRSALQHSVEDAFQASQEAKGCDCPPGVCLGEIASDLGLTGEATAIVPGGPGVDHASIGASIARQLEAILPSGPNGERPQVFFDGAFDRQGRRLDVPDDQYVSAGGPGVLFETLEPGADSSYRVDEEEEPAGIDPFALLGETMKAALVEAEEKALAFEKRTVVSQLARGFENFGYAAATISRLVDETYAAEA